MSNKRELAVLRGFDIAVADIADQLHLCHPLLSFESDPNGLYVARRFNWRNDQRGLAAADPSEASELATLFPRAQRRSIASGEGVVVAGAGFVQATDAAEIRLSGCEMSFKRVHEPEFWIGTATQKIFKDLQARLVDEARTAFDDELGEAACLGRHLSERGNAALLLLRRCGPLRREDLAIRQLAGARQNRELDLYRRLLIRFEIELDARQDDLHRKVDRHIELAISLLSHTTVDLVPKLEAMLEAVQAMDDALNPETQRGRVGAASEKNLKKAKDAVGEIRRLVTAMQAADSPDVSRVDAHRSHATG